MSELISSREWKTFALNAISRAKEYREWVEIARENEQHERVSKYEDCALTAEGDALFYEQQYKYALEREKQQRAYRAELFGDAA